MTQFLQKDEAPLRDEVVKTDRTLSDVWLRFWWKLIGSVVDSVNLPGGVLSYANKSHTVSGATQQIPFDTVVSSTGVTTDLTNFRIVIITPGLYRLWARGSWTTNAVGDRGLYLYKNGAEADRDYRPANATAGETTVQHVTWALKLVKDDYIEVFAFQSSGGALRILGNQLSVEWVRR